MKKNEKFESLLKEYRAVLERTAEYKLKGRTLFNEFLDNSDAVYNYIDSEIPEKNRKSAEEKVRRIDDEIYKDFLAKLSQEEL